MDGAKDEAGVSIIASLGKVLFLCQAGLFVVAESSGEAQRLAQSRRRINNVGETCSEFRFLHCGMTSTFTERCLQLGTHVNKARETRESVKTGE